MLGLSLLLVCIFGSPQQSSSSPTVIQVEGIVVEGYEFPFTNSNKQWFDGGVVVMVASVGGGGASSGGEQQQAYPGFARLLTYSSNNNNNNNNNKPSCDIGKVENAGKSYWLNKEKVHFDEAMVECIGQTGQLAHHSNNLSAVFKLLDQKCPNLPEYYVGCRFVRHIDQNWRTPCGNTCFKNNVAWENGKQPENLSEDMCAVVKDGKLTYIDCTNPRPYLCQSNE